MRKKVLFLAVLVLIMISNVFSATYYVSKSGNDSNDGTTWGSAVLKIQTALNKCVSGDSIWVASGTYKEGKFLDVKSGISLYGGFAGTETLLDDRDTSANKTIIDGNHTYDCIRNEGLVDGFVITHGKGGVFAGGVFNRGILRNSEITENMSTNGSGGILNEESGSVINCIISGNDSPRYGGGVFNNHGNITDCLITKNSAETGGGVANYGLLTNCVIIGNMSTSRGGGVFNFGGANTKDGFIINCTIARNASSIGAGVLNYEGTVINSIIWRNYYSDYSYESVSKVYNSCFGEADGTNGNIRANPQFVNALGTDISSWDLHLAPSSPCIDSGNPAAERMPLTDKDGLLRPGTDGKVCMGAYESPDDYIPGSPAPTRIIYVSKTGDGTSGENWAHSFVSVYSALHAFENDNDLFEFRVAAGLYKEVGTQMVASKTLLTGGWSGNSDSPDERDVNEYKTIIDGNSAFQCIRNFGTVDGLFIQNGKASSGGGGYNRGTITNCYISGNTATDNSGGIENRYGLISNCVILGNSAGIHSGGIYNERGLIVNCTIAGNTASDDGGGTENYGSIANCIIWKNFPSDYFGDKENGISNSCFGLAENVNGNIYANPQFESLSGTDMSLWNLRLKSNSPCIDKGKINAAGMLSSDIEGNPRPGGDGKVCMGAYESLESYEPGIPAPVKILYVSKTGDNSSGADWTHAFTTISSALQYIIDDNDLTEIRVAGGLYKEGMPVIISSRNYFYGGWSGNPANPFERDIQAYKTVIDGEQTYQCMRNYGLTNGVFFQNGNSSGDGGGLYSSGIISNSEISACYSETNGGGAVNNGTMNNCIISGNTAGSSGGGLFNDGIVNDCKVSENCIIVLNASGYGAGGGIRNHGNLFNTVISGNSSVFGGGLFSEGGEINACILLKNHTTSEGGGAYIENTTLLRNSVIYDNSSMFGGGVYSWGTVTGCKIINNISSEEGGGVINQSVISNSIISDNLSSGSDGGGVFNLEFSDVINCTIIKNSCSGSGGGVYNYKGNIFNCIVWDNTASDCYTIDGTISYSCYKESDGTNNNINTDPLFVDTSSTDSLNWDLHLKHESPCIDTGTSETIISFMTGTNVAVPDDMDGISRPKRNEYDMGAYEYYLPGDVDDDGDVDLIDVKILRDYLCGRIMLTSSQKIIGDLNKDHTIDISDIVALLNKINSSKYKK